MGTGQVRDRQYQIQLRQKYGDVVRLWCGQELVMIFDPDIWMDVLRKEGPNPFGAAMDIWPLVKFTELHSVSFFATAHGEAWREPRRKFQTHVFSHAAVDQYQPGISSVAHDAASFLRQNPVPDLGELTMNVSFEMVAQILLGKRMGLLDRSSSTTVKHFVDHAIASFRIISKLLFVPKVNNNLMLRSMPLWRRFETAMQGVMEHGTTLLDETESTQPPDAVFTKLLKEDAMTREVKLANLIGLLQAAVDTTTAIFIWNIYQLARHPAEQERLREEVRRVLPGGDYCKQLAPQVPYLKAFTREVQRYSPAAAGTNRRLPFPIELENTTVPSNAMLLFSGLSFNKDGDLLGADPDVFHPERWLAARDVPKGVDARKPHVTENGAVAPAPILSHPLLATPFGFGPRMCVGARIAQTEINTFVSRLVHDFRISMDPAVQEISVAHPLLCVPDPTPRLRFDPVM